MLPRGPLDIAICILNIKAVGLMVSEIYDFPIISLMEILIHRAWPVWTPGVYVVEHLMLATY